MSLFAIAIPIPSSKIEQWKKFTSELRGARKTEYLESRKRLGVRERSFLQHTPQGDMVIITLEGNEPAKAFAEMGRGTDPFTTWFKKQVSEIHGVDLGAQQAPPMPEMIIDSQ